MAQFTQGSSRLATLVYDGDAQALTTFLAALNEIHGTSVRLTFSTDLSKETGSALQAGSWWVRYSHTMPDTLTVRINLASATLGGDKFELRLPKAGPWGRTSHWRRQPFGNGAGFELPVQWAAGSRRQRVH